MSKKFSPEALIAARARARLTQEKLGEKVGITAHQILRYEKGRA